MALSACKDNIIIIYCNNIIVIPNKMFINTAVTLIQQLSHFNKVFTTRKFIKLKCLL